MRLTLWDREVRSSPKENQSLEVKVKGISEMEFSLSIFDYTFKLLILRLAKPSPIPLLLQECKSASSQQAN